MFRFTVKGQSGSFSDEEVEMSILYDKQKQICPAEQSDGKTGLAINRIGYINLGPGTLDGWLATGSEDGCFRLWNIFGPMNQMVLEVRYTGPVCAIGSAIMKPIPVDSRPGASELRWLSRGQIVLATKTGGLTCLSLTAEPGRILQEAGDHGLFLLGPKLVDCEPSKVLAWQTDGPIIASDAIMLGDDRDTSIVATATEAG